MIEWHSHRKARHKMAKITNTQVKEMAREALDNWLFDDDTDPDGAIKRGLDYLASEGDWDQEVIEARLKGTDDWDGLNEWADFLGQK